MSAPAELVERAQRGERIVTALMVGNDRDLAVEIAEEETEMMVLALTLAELVVHVHASWARATGMTPAKALEGWQAMCLDLAEGRDREAGR